MFYLFIYLSLWHANTFGSTCAVKRRTLVTFTSCVFGGGSSFSIQIVFIYLFNHLFIIVCLFIYSFIYLCIYLFYHLSIVHLFSLSYIYVPFIYFFIYCLFISFFIYIYIFIYLYYFILVCVRLLCIERCACVHVCVCMSVDHIADRFQHLCYILIHIVYFVASGDLPILPILLHWLRQKLLYSILLL